jgi:hypothetical protein
MDEIKKMSSISKCQCIKKNEYSDVFLKLTDDFLEDIQNNYEYIDSIFEKVINIYMEFIKKNRIEAYIRMEEFLDENSTNYNSVSVINFAHPMFRVRIKGSYNEDNCFEYYHIPFDLRHNVGNQRFSIAGQPMIYMAESLPIALKEVGKNIRSVNSALYLPGFSSFYNEAIYDITNSVSANLSGIRLLCSDGSVIDYNNDGITFSKSNFRKMIADSIFYQLLMFPVQNVDKGVFIQEYVLPQLMMDILRKRNYCGIKYETSQEYSWKCTTQFKTVPDKNYCFFVPYSSDRYSKSFLGKFFYVICNNKTVKRDSITFRALFEEYNKKVKDQNKVFNMTDYITYTRWIEGHMKQ